MSENATDPGGASPDGTGERPPLRVRLRRLILGGPRDLADRSIFHRLALVPFLAWVGLGADGLSSSSYGPEEAFRTLGEHTYLAVILAAMIAATILIIAAAYSRIIEQFPHGGGGYVVATKLLGERTGVVSGSALVVDYVLTITVSIAAAGDAIFSFLPADWHVWKLLAEIAFIVGLTALNIRGVRESVMALLPIFVVFLATHALLIVGGFILHGSRLEETAAGVNQGFSAGLQSLGLGGMAVLLVRAYSMGGGTYTGLEAVSNGLPIMREPHVRTGKRTMTYMAASLAFTAGGLLILYLLWDVRHVAGKTLNAVLAGSFADEFRLGAAFVIITLLSEGALLIVGAQAGFIDGPRVLANMAIDSWVPHRFAALSERLTTQNGILLMGGAAIATLVYARGDVRHLVVMYSINVFLTFSLSMLAMLRHILKTRTGHRHWRRRAALFGAGLMLCATILVMTSVMKFREGGWVTLLVTTALVLFCFRIRRHYRLVGRKLEQLYAELGDLPAEPAGGPQDLDPAGPTAAILVGGYGGLGIHTLLNVFRLFPRNFRNVVFLSVAVVDSGGFKGRDDIDALKARTEEMLGRYVKLARGLGLAATHRYHVGTDIVAEAERLCLDVSKEFPGTIFFAGKIIFRRERWYQSILHNETAFAVQKRLQWAGQTMVILPARVR
jgi:amino acid transporter